MDVPYVSTPASHVSHLTRVAVISIRMPSAMTPVKKVARMVRRIYCFHNNNRNIMRNDSSEQNVRLVLITKVIKWQMGSCRCVGGVWVVGLKCGYMGYTGN